MFNYQNPLAACPEGLGAAGCRTGEVAQGGWRNAKAPLVHGASKQAREQEWLGSVGLRGICCSLGRSGWKMMKRWHHKCNLLELGAWQDSRSGCWKGRKMPWKCRSFSSRRSDTCETEHGTGSFPEAPKPQNTISPTRPRERSVLHNFHLTGTNLAE